METIKNPLFGLNLLLKTILTPFAKIKIKTLPARPKSHNKMIRLTRKRLKTWKSIWRHLTWKNLCESMKKRSSSAFQATTLVYLAKTVNKFQWPYFKGLLQKSKMTTC